jgi:hypothetical protein
MLDEKTPFSGLSDPQDAEVTQYRAVSGWAAGGLVLGLLSPLALAFPLLWIVPVAGIALSALALKRIADAAPALIGRKAAVAGLLLSVLSGAMAPADWFTYRHLIDREARQFAEQWFAFLRQGEPQYADQLSVNPALRVPLDPEVWKHYALGTEERTRLERFVQQPEIRSLLHLGRNARARYYDTEDLGWEDSDEVVRQVWAVTSQEGGQKKTFFVRLVMKRYHLPENRAGWQVSEFHGGIRPEAMGEEKTS